MILYATTEQVGRGSLFVCFTGDGVAVEAWFHQLQVDLADISPDEITQAKRRWYLHALPISALPRPPQPQPTPTKAEP